jgi:hypothetical protein
LLKTGEVVLRNRSVELNGIDFLGRIAVSVWEIRGVFKEGAREIAEKLSRYGPLEFSSAIKGAPNLDNPTHALTNSSILVLLNDATNSVETMSPSSKVAATIEAWSHPGVLSTANTCTLEQVP